MLLGSTSHKQISDRLEYNLFPIWASTHMCQDTTPTCAECAYEISQMGGGGGAVAPPEKPRNPRKLLGGAYFHVYSIRPLLPLGIKFRQTMNCTQCHSNMTYIASYDRLPQHLHLFLFPLVFVCVCVWACKDTTSGGPLNVFNHVKGDVRQVGTSPDHTNQFLINFADMFALRNAIL